MAPSQAASSLRELMFMVGRVLQNLSCRRWALWTMRSRMASGSPNTAECPQYRNVCQQ